LQKRYSKEKLQKYLTLCEENGPLETVLLNKKIVLFSNDFFELILFKNMFASGNKELKALSRKSLECVCGIKEEELKELLLKKTAITGKISILLS